MLFCKAVTDQSFLTSVFFQNSYRSIISDTLLLFATVIGKDKVGIIAGVCQYLSDISVNILNISQTIVEGYFNMMMIVDFTNCTKEIAVVVNEMEELGKTIGVDIHCQREDIFEKMHRL